MKDQITRQAQEMLAAAARIEVPAEVRAMAEDGVAKAREAYAKWNAAAQNGTKAIEDVALTAHAAAKTVTEKVYANALANTEATLDAAAKLARARTLNEAAQVQAKFVQDQIAAVTEQGKAVFELSVRVAKETTDAMTAIATKVAEDLKKVA